MKPRMLPKSPSVPDLHGSARVRNIHLEMKRNASPMLPSWKPVDTIQTHDILPKRSSMLRVESTYMDDDENLSFIDLYGDEVASQRLGDNNPNNDDTDNEQEDQNNDTSRSDGGNVDSLVTGSDLRTTSGNSGSITSMNTTVNVSPSFPSKPKIVRDPNGIYDQYGFKKQNNVISEQAYNRWWKNYDPYCQRRKLKWKIFLEKHKIQPSASQDLPTRFPARSEKLKRYIRKGIPSDWRGNAWWYFAEGDDLLKQNPGKYKSLVDKMDRLLNLPQGNDRDKYNKIFMNMEIIERDLNRTFPDNIYFQQDPNSSREPEMISALRRVLVTFSIYNPRIGYCQSMNFLAGLLLLFLEEEKAFWMLAIITSKYLPGVHDVNLEGVNIDQGVLMLCIREYLPDIWKTIERTCETTAYHDVFQSRKSHFKNEFLFKLPPITLCTVSWFMSCFIGIVPIETALRIWDCLFYEGSHFLFKISLAVIKICEHELLHKKYQSRITSKYSKSNGDDSDIELFQLVQSLPKKILDPNDLFEKSIFKRIVNFNSLEQAEIDRCRKYVMSQRKKYKHFVDMSNNRGGTGDISSTTTTTTTSNTAGGKSSGSSKYDLSVSSSEESIMTVEDLSDVLMRETYGFKRTLTNVSWNNLGLKGRVRQIRKKKDR